MKINNNIWLLAILLIGFLSCESDDDSLADPYINETETQIPTQSFSSGSADFSKFVAVGNSLTAGYSDGALFAKGQQVSFPNILAQRFALAGGGNFTQPLMDDDNGGLLLNSTPIAAPRLIFNPINQTPVPVNAAPTTDITNVLSGSFNNMGVPGAKSFHLLAPNYGDVAGVMTGTANPYFVRMASSTSTTVIADAMAQNPTFFSLWIGNNDVLGYATTGGDGTDPITPQTMFDNAMGGIVATLASNSDGIISNIPNVTDTPYFTTVPFAPLDPTNPDFGPQIPTLNAVFGQLNQVYSFLGVPERSVVFSTTAASAVVIKDESLADISVQITAVLNASPTFPAFVQSFGLPAAAAPVVANILGQMYGQTRQANTNDLLVLPSRNVIGTINTDNETFLINQGLTASLAAQFSAEGITYPLEDKWVLLPTEQTEIANATAAFNQTIENLAMQYDLAFFDVNTFFSGVATNGYQAGSAFLTSDYVTGGTFSLDGIHPSPRGYAVIANQMINIINTKYGSNLPTVNPVDYTGLYLD